MKNMRRYLCLVLVFALLFSLAALALFATRHAGIHGFDAECSICVAVCGVSNLLEELLLALFAGAAAIVPVITIGALLLRFREALAFLFTPVGLRVKMLN